MRSFIICTLDHIYYYDNDIKDGQIGGVYSTNGRYDESIQNLKGRDHAEYVGVDGSIILEWILGK
jgi:hypothetical protein